MGYYYGLYLISQKNQDILRNFRKQQAVIRMHNTIIEYLNNSFYNHEEVKMISPELERQLYDGKYNFI